MIPKLPKKLKAQSSNVVGIIHDPDTQTLDVTFHGGRVYRYTNVPTEKANAFKAAPSKGKFLNEHIIPHHSTERIQVGLRPVSR